MIEVQIALPGPELTLALPAREASVPIARQALRAQGQALGADEAVLEDAELAVTEAAANVVEHAYGDGEDGVLEIAIRPRPTQLLVSVRDRGGGMESAAPHAREGDRGFGLPIITSVSTETAIKDLDGGGTDVQMTFDLGVDAVPAADDLSTASDAVERVVRRLVAVIAAQGEMSSERIVEGLLVAELVTKHAFEQLVEEQARLELESLAGGFELRVGPLRVGGGAEVIAASELPAVGPVIAQLCDEFRVEPSDGGSPAGAERLVVRVHSAAA